MLSEHAQQADRYPVQDSDKTMYLYGSGQATLICSVLHVCTVELQQGERVQPNGIHLGDSVRWKVTPTVGEGQKTFLIVKPVGIDLETNMVVVTDRHSYDIRMVSRSNTRISKIAFNYPADAEAEWKRYYADVERKEAEALAARMAITTRKVSDQQAAQAAAEAPPVAVREEIPHPTAVDVLSDLDFDYSISGCDECDWNPVRVYNNGEQTVIQMPDLRGKEAPALLVVSHQGENLVNYRVLDDRYVVDQVFREAALIIGVGEKQQRVTIKRNSNSNR
jgi:type IV secretion system protein VirB9